MTAGPELEIGQDRVTSQRRIAKLKNPPKNPRTPPKAAPISKMVLPHTPAERSPGPSISIEKATAEPRRLPP